jgi:large subunit ribosomal protein L15
MRIHDLSPAPGSTKNRKRVGRGIGGKGGKTAGRGTKGQHSRGRGKVARGFEGGQTGLKQRVPKLKGFNNPFRVEYSPVNLDQIAGTGEIDITPEVLVAKGLVRKGTFVKVLARGEITTAVNVTAHAVSKAADTAITAAGGSVTLLPLPFKQGRPPVQGNQFANR